MVFKWELPRRKQWLKSPDWVSKVPHPVEVLVAKPDEPIWPPGPTCWKEKSDSWKLCLTFTGVSQRGWFSHYTKEISVLPSLKRSKVFCFQSFLKPLSFSFRLAFILFLSIKFLLNSSIENTQLLNRRDLFEVMLIINHCLSQSLCRSVVSWELMTCLVLTPNPSPLFINFWTQVLFISSWLSWNSIYQSGWPPVHKAPSASASRVLGIRLGPLLTFLLTKYQLLLHLSTLYRFALIFCCFTLSSRHIQPVAHQLYAATMHNWCPM